MGLSAYFPFFLFRNAWPSSAVLTMVRAFFMGDFFGLAGADGADLLRSFRPSDVFIGPHSALASSATAAIVLTLLALALPGVFFLI